MMRWCAWLCLVLILLAGCAQAQPLITPAAAAGARITPTRTSVPLLASRQTVGAPPAAQTAVSSDPGVPSETAVSAETAGSSDPVETPLPAPTLSDPTAVPLAAATLQPEADQSSAEGPLSPAAVSVAESWQQPWQFFSSSFTSGGTVVYRLRYPSGWSAYPGEAGAVTLQNFAGDPADGVPLVPGGIRLAITPMLAERTNGFPAPNTRVLAAGRPGTRQVLLDTSLGQTIWSVRLYGIGDSSAALNLIAALRQPNGEPGSAAKTEGTSLLDAVLETLEIYDWTQPAPAPSALDSSTADDWQSYTTRLDSSAGPVQVSFRFPQGWWVYPRGASGFELMNYVDGTAGAGGLQPQGGIRLSVSASACADVGGCPEKPDYLFTGLPGTREVLIQPGGETNWLVRIYADRRQVTLFGTVSGSDSVVARQVQLLNMILRTLKVR